MSLTLATVIDHTRDDLRRADTTAGLYILAIAGLAALVGEISDQLTPTAKLAVSAAALPAAVTVVCAAVVLWPRRSRGLPTPGSWLHAARQPSWQALRDVYAEGNDEERAALQLWHLSPIVARKYRWLRPATVGLVATVAVLLAVGVGLVLTA